MPKSRERSARSPRRSRQRGAAMVEAAIVMPLVLLVLMSIVEFGRLFYTKITVESAVRQAARFAVTGNAMADPDDPSANLPRAEGIRRYLMTHTPHVDVKPGKVTLDPADGGGPGDVVKVTAEFDFTFITPLISQFFTNGEYAFEYTTTMKNEPVFTDRRRS